ncbi:MAG: xanthine dehydrogenase family protein subunit M [Proteobacteria bacterium]|nr:xanthine dehydrogenase family protein subunit M [Pseudomonadota bacterium]
MKPPPFHYHDPRCLDDALGLLAEKENAKLLAGGQSLMPMLNMRFVFPDDVIDLNRIPELTSIGEDEGLVRIGAMTRQCALERSEVIRDHCPIIIEALRYVGHIQTRNRGTIGGSLCHLDPSAELPTVAQGLDATIHIQSKRGARTLAMEDFPAFYMTPAIEPDEIVTAVEFAPWPKDHGFAFVEFARRLGDFAIVGVAVLLVVSADGSISRASITLGGVGQAPIRCTAAEEIVTGSNDSDAAMREAAETCRKIDAMDDLHVSGVYRQKLAVALTLRALRKAYDRAIGESVA